MIISTYLQLFFSNAFYHICCILLSMFIVKLSNLKSCNICLLTFLAALLFIRMTDWESMVSVFKVVFMHPQETENKSVSFGFYISNWKSGGHPFTIYSDNFELLCDLGQDEKKITTTSDRLNNLQNTCSLLCSLPSQYAPVVSMKAEWLSLKALQKQDQDVFR